MDIIYLVRMECKTPSGSYPLAHESIMVANVVEHFLRINVVDADSLLGRCTAREDGCHGISLWTCPIIVFAIMTMPSCTLHTHVLEHTTCTLTTHTHTLMYLNTPHSQHTHTLMYVNTPHSIYSQHIHMHLLTNSTYYIHTPQTHPTIQQHTLTHIYHIVHQTYHTCMHHVHTDTQTPSTHAHTHSPS